MGRSLYLIFVVACALALQGCNGGTPPDDVQDDVPDADLIGTLWTLQSIEVPEKPDILPGAKWTYPIQFFENYYFEGGIDCNHLGGEYTLDDDNSLLMTNIGATKILCRDSNDYCG